MKQCNDTITLFNSHWDESLGDDAWYPTVIHGVHWWLTDASAVDTARGGLVAANKCTVRIPMDADSGESAYADPIAYTAAEDVTGLWTLAAGSVIVKAEVPAGDWTPARLKIAYADCMTVLNVTDNRQAPRAPHFKVVGS